MWLRCVMGDQSEVAVEPGAVRNADGWFRFMVETDLAPGLRALGFTGSNETFRLPGESHLGELRIIRADPNPRSTRFTLALGVTPTDEWSVQRRVRPYLSQSYTRHAWRQTIGKVVLVGSGIPIGDLWWRIDAGQPFGSVAREVLTVVREFALPAFDRQFAR